MSSLIKTWLDMEYLHRFFYYTQGHDILKPSNVLLDEDLVAHVVIMTRIYMRVMGRSTNIAVKVLRLSISISRTTEKFQTRN
jgi:hypothetical protein